MKSGRGEWIRTTDPSVPNRVLYQAEPRPDKSVNTHSTPTPPIEVNCFRASLWVLLDAQRADRVHVGGAPRGDQRGRHSC